MNRRCKATFHNGPRPMRILLLTFIASCVAFAQRLELQYRLSALKNWRMWLLSSLAIEAISNYRFANDSEGRPFIEARISKGQYATYKPGDEAISIAEESDGDAWRVKVIDGESRG